MCPVWRYAPWHPVVSSPGVTIFVPAPLRAYCAGEAELSLNAGTVQDALAWLETSHPALHRNVRDETGAVRRHLNVFVNADNIL